MKEGVNYRLLSDARQFFDERLGVHIVSYQFTHTAVSRPKEVLDKDCFKKCSICGKELYRVEGALDEETGELTTMVTSSAHMIFTDIEGKEWPTCYKLKACFKQVGFSPDGNVETYQTPPDFESYYGRKLLGDDEEKPDGYDELVSKLEKNYYEVVRPFLKVWINKEIGKSNVTQFWREFKKVQRSHLEFFEDPPSKKQAGERILKAIGVKNV